MTRHHLTITLWGVMVALAACGGRNLDAGPQVIFVDDDDNPDDDSTGGAGGLVEMGGFGGAGGASDGGGGEGASGAGSPIDCFGCLASNCPNAVACITDPACIEGITCAVTDCLGGGGTPDLMCLSDCFNGDLDAAFQAFEVITCALMSCQDECGALLPFP